MKNMINNWKNYSEDQLMCIHKDCHEGKIKLTATEYNTVVNLCIKKMQYRVFPAQVKASLQQVGHEMTDDEMKALIVAYKAYDDQEWGKCKSSLETFFKHLSPEMAQRINISDWYPYHIEIWLMMLSKTNLCLQPEGTSVHPFFVIMYKWAFKDANEDQIHQSWDDMQKEIPKVVAFVKTASNNYEGCKICNMVRMAEELKIMLPQKAGKVLSGEIDIEDVYAENSMYHFV